MQDKLTESKIIAILSLMGYELVESKYKLVKADGKTMNNHRLSYYLKDTQNKTGKLTFTDGRKSFKNGLAIDIAITENKDLDRPLKIQNRGEFLMILTIDEEKENELIEKSKNNINTTGISTEGIYTYFQTVYPEISPEDKELIDEKVSKEELNTSLIELQEYIRKTVMLSTDTLNKQVKDAYENIVTDLRTELTIITNKQNIINDRTVELTTNQIEFSKKINCDIWHACIVLCIVICVCTVIICLCH